MRKHKRKAEILSNDVKRTKWRSILSERQKYKVKYKKYYLIIKKL